MFFWLPLILAVEAAHDDAALIRGVQRRDAEALAGLYDRTPDVPPDTGVPPDAPETAQAYDPGGPSLTTAIREQLGLRLENRRDSVDVLGDRQD